MKKKLLRILGVLFLVFLALLIAVPFFLEGKIAAIIKNKVNQNIHATLDFKEASLSLIKSFPKANVDLQEVVLINKAPFEGDTLFAAKDIVLDLSITELFKSSEEPIVIERLLLDGAKVHVQVDAQENANYDIAIEEEGAATETEAEAETPSFSLNMQGYAITNATIVYDDFATGMHLALDQLNHSGSGDLSLQRSQLQTKTAALVSFEMDSTHYLKNNKIALDALIGVDLEQQKFTFLENKALINQLPLVFDGFVKMNENSQEVDVSFKTPSSDFKNFLAVIPEAYAANLDGVETSGNFEVQGVFKGVVDEDHIPTFSINLNSENASFKYPDLPKAVSQVYIDADIHNKTGVTADTYVTVDRLSFKIDQDQFNLNAKILDLLGNTKLNLHADGIINLANIAKAYPVPEDYGLKGILKANVSTAFDMASLEKHQYQNTKTSGKASLSDFHYESAELKHPVDIKEAAIAFNPQTVSLDRFSGTTGQTDFLATGTLDNLLGYLFNEEKLAGRFNLKSNTLALDDFMVEEAAATEEVETPEEALGRIKIPSFLDATIAATANTVLYDDLNLKNVVGDLVVKDETATLNNLSSNIFGGKLMLNGKVSTKGDTNTFDMGLGIDGFKIAESFKSIGLFKALAPVAQALQGQLNSQIKLSGDLNPDMTPNLATLSGDLLGQLLSAKVNTEKAPALAALDNQFGFIDFKALNLENVKAALSFKDGKVATKPIALKYKDIPISIAGVHTFDKKMEYKAVLDVPAKYLGKEVNSLIAKLNDPALADLTVPVTANIGGSYTSPKVSTDLTSGVKNLTTQLVEIQKQKLLDQGKDKAKDLLGGLLGGNKKDTTGKKDTAVADALGGLLGGKKDTTAVDSTQTKDPVKDAANSILGGLFGKKKKKDSVN